MKINCYTQFLDYACRRISENFHFKAEEGGTEEAKIKLQKYDDVHNESNVKAEKTTENVLKTMRQLQIICFRGYIVVARCVTITELLYANIKLQKLLKSLHQFSD